MSVPNEPISRQRPLGVSQEPRIRDVQAPKAAQSANFGVESGESVSSGGVGSSARSEASSAEEPQPRGARSVPPWYITNKVAAGAEANWRLARFQRRQRSSVWLIGAAREAAGLDRDSSNDDSNEWVRPLRPARCRWRVAAAVGVHADADHGAHYSGLSRCGSIWACPVCSAVIRARRAEEVTRAAETAGELGHGMMFVTLTLRHKDSDKLAESIDLLLEAWRKVQTWRAWRKLADRVGLVGTIRSTEVTYGGNGWHPHSHLLMVTEKPLSEAQLSSFTGEITEMWIKAVDKLGGRLPSREHGVDVRLVDEGAGVTVADYVVKVQEKQGERRTKIGLELMRGDLKSGRAGSFMPFELLDAEGKAIEIPRRLWIEYVTATKGRRALSWTRGLREMLLPDEEEQSDEELIEDTEQAELVAIIAGPDYDRRLKNSPEYLAAVLEAAEAGDVGFIEDLVADQSEAPPPREQTSKVRFG